MCQDCPLVRGAIEAQVYFKVQARTYEHALKEIKKLFGFPGDLALEYVPDKIKLILTEVK
jgi:hypothetical protein